MNLALLISNPPDASALMEASRSFGNYDLAAALADLIDNSITAGATKISIDCSYDGDVSFIRIADDGRGMSEEELKNAMRPASKNPLEDRSADDLGRFGLGLKTASFSQARNLTVISKKDDKVFAANWDLDSISDWTMLCYSDEEANAHFIENPIFETVTEVIWRKLDRVTEEGAMSSEDFNRLLISSADQLSLIFHRYMERQTSPTKKSIMLYLNGRKLEPHDPFKRNHPATQQLDTETLSVTGSKVVITPYILPHFSKLPPNEYERLAGEEGYVRNQGFYVYRNRRLIIHGTWFKLFRHGELSKLARVMVDIPNTLDAQWRITVDKSDAQIPTTLKRRLKDLTEKISNQSSRVYRQRGSKIHRSDVSPVWNRTVTKGRIQFTVNTDNRGISNFVDTLSSSQKSHFTDILRIIASGFPVEAIHTDFSENPNNIVQAETEPEEIVRLVKELSEGLKQSGLSKEEVFDVIKTTAPFSDYIEIIAGALNESGNK